jgi:hypothetical protein
MFAVTFIEEKSYGESIMAAYDYYDEQYELRPENDISIYYPEWEHFNPDKLEYSI